MEKTYYNKFFRNLKYNFVLLNDGVKGGYQEVIWVLVEKTFGNGTPMMGPDLGVWESLSNQTHIQEGNCGFEYAYNCSQIERRVQATSQETEHTAKFFRLLQRLHFNARASCVALSYENRQPLKIRCRPLIYK